MKQCTRRLIQRWVQRAFKKASGATTPRLLSGSLSQSSVKRTKKHIDAAKGLVEKPDTQAKAQERMKVNAKLAHPQIIAFWERFDAELAKRKYPFIAFEMYRSNERQNRLLKQGVTKAKGGSSPHNYGMAVDVVHSKRFWDLTRTEWDIIGAIGKEVARKLGIKVEWGGDWDFYDPAHWQLAEWRAKTRDPAADEKKVIKWAASRKYGEKEAIQADEYFRFLKARL